MPALTTHDKGINNMTAPTPPPYNPPPGYELTKKKSWFARHKILTGLGALIIIAIIASAAGGGGSSDNENASDNTPTSDATTAPGATKAADKPADKPAAKTPNYPGAKEEDKVRKPGEAVNLSGWTTTATALKYRTFNQFSGRNICTTVTMVNRDDEQQEYSSLSWKLQTPNGNVQDMTFTGEDNELGSEGLAPGGKVTKIVCFEDKKAGKGLYVLSWQPDVFSHEERGVWLNRL
jgi:hypothetical protein